MGGRREGGLRPGPDGPAGVESLLLLFIADFWLAGRRRWRARAWEPGALLPVAPSQCLLASPPGVVSLVSDGRQSLPSLRETISPPSERQGILTPVDGLLTVEGCEVERSQKGRTSFGD